MAATIKEDKIPTEPIKLDLVDGDDEYVSVTAALGMLNITKVVMARLLREGTLPYKPDKLDKRRKWVKVSDVNNLKRQSPSAAAPQNGSSAPRGKANDNFHGR